MFKIMGVNMCQYTVILYEINSYLPMFPGIFASNILPGGELNEIMLNVLPHSWSKRAVIIRFEFKIKKHISLFGLF